MRVYFVLICVALCVISFGKSASSSIPRDPFYGISPEDLSYYKPSSDFIKCKEGSKKFSKSRLNDDFCDCPDGTDEPDTSACSTGKFYCHNIGHIPLTVFSSRVNDGICDCCDGSDEYDGKAKCPNTCWEAGKATRDKLQKKIAMYLEGVILRKKEVEQARIAYAKDESELTKLKSEEKKLNGLVQQLKERKEQVDELEDKLRLQEEEEKEKREAQVETDVVEKTKDSEDKSTESTHEDIAGNTDDDPFNDDLKVVNDKKETAKVESSDTFEHEGSPHNEIEDVEKYEDDSEAVPEINDEAGSGVEPHDVKEMANGVPENTEELSREELGRLVASRSTGENHGGAKDDSHESSEEMPEQTHGDEEEEEDGYASDDVPKYDPPGKYDDGNDDDMDETYEEDSTSFKSEAEDGIDLLDSYTTSLSNPSWLEKIQHTVRNILRPLNLFQHLVNISDAACVRKEYDEFSNKLSKMESRISTLSEKLKHDFGSEKEFYSFYDRCFESKQNKYVYKVCPYKQATQEEGYTATRLGNWEKFENSYRAMIFLNGDKCWNGPDRSLKVRLRCGLNDEITDVDEPSRCEYVALLSTPAACTEDKLKELQNKRDSLNKQQPEKHDEL